MNHGNPSGDHDQPAVRVMLRGDASGPHGWELRAGSSGSFESAQSKPQATTFAGLARLEQQLRGQGTIDAVAAADELWQQRMVLARVAEAWSTLSRVGGRRRRDVRSMAP
jgi:hypothetical protein